MGLSQLLDSLLVHKAGASIKTMNLAGCARMQLNILVLQQNLKNIEEGDSVALTRSARYWDFFADGPESVIAWARESQPPLPFSYDELRLVVELAYSEALLSDRREVAMQAKRELADRLLTLSEHLWQS